MYKIPPKYQVLCRQRSRAEQQTNYVVSEVHRNDEHDHPGLSSLLKIKMKMATNFIRWGAT